MKKRKTTIVIISTVIIAIIICLAALKCLQVNFDSFFWTNFFQNLIPNFVIIGFAILVLDRILEDQRNKEIKAVNLKTAQHVHLLLERLCVRILDFVEIKKIEEITAKPSTDDWTMFPLALDDFSKHLKTSEIEKKLYEKIISSNNKLDTVREFVKIIETDSKNLVENLKKIYPIADSKIFEIFDGSWIELSASLKIFETMNETTKSKRISEKDKRNIKKMLKENTELLFIVSYSIAKPKLTKFFENILLSAKKARENELNANL